MEAENREWASYFKKCANFSDHDLHALALTRGGAAIVCFLVCVLALLVLLCKRGLAGMKDSTQTRLMSYLLLSTTAYLLVLSAHIEHYWYNNSRGRIPKHHWQVYNILLVSYG